MRTPDARPGSRRRRLVSQRTFQDFTRITCPANRPARAERIAVAHRQHLGAKMRDAGREVSLYRGDLPTSQSVPGNWTGGSRATWKRSSSRRSTKTRKAAIRPPVRWPKTCGGSSTMNQFWPSVPRPGNGRGACAAETHGSPGLLADDLTGYRAACADAFMKFGAVRDPSASNRLAYAAIYSPGAVHDLEAVVGAAVQSTKLQPDGGAERITARRPSRWALCRGTRTVPKISPAVRAPSLGLAVSGHDPEPAGPTR